MAYSRFSFTFGCLLWVATTAVDAQSEAVAFELSEPMRIDGIVDESFAERLPLEGFAQFAPQPLSASKQRTQVWVAYDDVALYVAARMYDSAPDSILAQLSERDRLRNTDWFGVTINPYRDGINATNFIVTPAGVQYDSKFSSDTRDDNQIMQSGDRSWDGVWASAAAKTPDGWTAELRIPYSALRFPDQAVQTWDINFARQVRRYREESFWNPIDPQGPRATTQMGKLTGISDIRPPIRLQATPFITAGANVNTDPRRSTKVKSSTSLGGGLDLKYGLSDAFTLDMTAIPDFSNARSDDQVLNLGANEIFFSENRAFFTEGVELFNKGSFFYSRRVGGFPINFDNAYEGLSESEEVIDNPTRTQLLNATKVSGRMANGLGIGVFNAVEGPTYATIRDADNGQEREVRTAPTTNYSVVSLDQNLANNSFVTLINTTVLRSGSNYDANLTGTVWDIRDKANDWSINGSAAISQQYGLPIPQTEGEPIREDVFGHTVELSIDRLTGRLRYGANYTEESDTYDPNDLGFLFFNNERSGEVYAEYNWFEPFGPFNSASVGSFLATNYLYEPSELTATVFGGRSRFTTRKFFTFGVRGFSELTDAREYQDSRTPGRFIRIPQYFEVGGFISSDYRQPFALDIRGEYGTFYSDGRSKNIQLSVSPRVRVGDRLAMRVRGNVRLGKRFLGYVGHSAAAIDRFDLLAAQTPYRLLDDERVIGFDGLKDDGILGSYRDVPQVELEASAEYSFNANMNINLRARHYWSRVNHVEFFETFSDGYPRATTYTGLTPGGELVHDQNFNAFNVDLFYRWRFAPGSDVFLSYKTQSFFGGSDTEGYLANFGALGNERVDNTLTLKVVYFLDAAAL